MELFMLIKFTFYYSVTGMVRLTVCVEVSGTCRFTVSTIMTQSHFAVLCGVPVISVIIPVTRGSGLLSGKQT